MEGKPRIPPDALGKLCKEGRDVASYLFQVPDDEAQWQRLREIVQAILKEARATKRRELPRIAQEMNDALSDKPTAQTAELMQSGFDRMFRLWQAARSGLF
ncbi:MAG: hypothetical protein GTO22_02635 [Gemmatimonadales bacterium]|nr:hypothetical protein [Gemmatimonadales bacterium]